MTDVNKMLADFSNAVINSNIDISSLINNEINLKDMLQNMWRLEEFHNNVKTEKPLVAKDDNAANDMRKSGNEHFLNGELDKALSCYNDCIINAVQPEDNDSSRTLSLGFSNRSAVLFVMKHYDLCLADIKNAFTHNYPEEIHQKLIIREIKCHFAKFDLEAAKYTYERYTTDDKYKHNTKLLESLTTVMSDSTREFNEKNKNEELPVKEIPLNMNINQKFHSASDALEFSLSPKKGRGFIAKRDIQPGELLFREKAYANFLYDAYLLTHCSYCLRRIKLTPIPCTTCTNVVFCSDKCKVEADELFHTVECSILPMFSKLNNCIGSIVFRIICQTDVKHLLQQFKLYEEECITATQSEFGFNPEGVYQSEDLRTVFHLVTNKHLRSARDLTSRCFMSLFIMKILLGEAPWANMPELNNVNNSTLSQEQLNLASVIFVLTMNISCNAHSIIERNQSCDKRSIDLIGGGVFPTFSLVNHSCNPNMSTINYGFAQMGVANHFIKAGSEINETYGYSYELDSISRKYAIKNNYYFDCSCDACMEGWPTIGSLSYDIKCINCSENMYYQQCNKCSALYNNFNQLIEEFRAIVKKLKDSTPNYDDTYHAIKVITFINKYCEVPTKTLLRAKQILNQSLYLRAHLHLQEYFPRHIFK